MHTRQCSEHSGVLNHICIFEFHVLKLIHFLMVINCLLPYLKTYSEEVNLSKFAGKVAAVDASCWMQKGLEVSVSDWNTRQVNVY